MKTSIFSRNVDNTNPRFSFYNGIGLNGQTNYPNNYPKAPN